MPPARYAKIRKPVPCIAGHAATPDQYPQEGNRNSTRFHPPQARCSGRYRHKSAGTALPHTRRRVSVPVAAPDHASAIWRKCYPPHPPQVAQPNQKTTQHPQWNHSLSGFAHHITFGVETSHVLQCVRQGMIALQGVFTHGETATRAGQSSRPTTASANSTASATVHRVAPRMEEAKTTCTSLPKGRLAWPAPPHSPEAARAKAACW